MKDLTNPSEIEAALQDGDAVVLKHGARCPISAAARAAVSEFSKAHPDVPVYGVEVTGRRELSDVVADRFGVRHESPQVFVVRHGRPVWHAMHYDITADALASRLGSRDD